MLKNDYILRLIEQFVRVLERIIGLKERGALHEALEFLQAETRRIIGMDGAMLEMLSPDEIARALASPDRIYVAARVVEEMRDIHAKDDEHVRATALGVRAVRLYAKLGGDRGTFLADDSRKHAEGLAEQLATEALTDSERGDLLAAYEALGLYSLAEDTLFDMVEGASDPRTSVATGIDFYNRILSLPDAELEAGGLPRSEITDGMAALRNRLARLN